MSSVTLNRVLCSRPFLYQTICSFLQEAQLSFLNHHFRGVNTDAMTLVGRCISFEDSASNELTIARARALCSEKDRLAKFLSMYYAAVTEIDTSSGAVAKREVRAQLSKLNDLFYAHFIISEESCGNCADRLILFLDRIKCPREGHQGSLDRDRLFNDIKKFLVRENLALRFREVAGAPRLFSGSREFSALYTIQKGRTIHSVIQRHRFEELRGPSFALERLVAREELVMDAEIDHDSALEEAWRERCHGAIRMPQDGPHATASAYAIRVWMNNPEQHQNLVKHDLSDLRTADSHRILADLRLVHAWFLANEFQDLPRPLGALVLDYCHNESISDGPRFDYAKIATIFQNVYRRS